MYDFRFGDINCYGLLQILAFAFPEVSQAIYMLLSAGGGRFWLEGAFPRPNEFFGYSPDRDDDGVLADFSGDGVPDLLIRHLSAGQRFLVVFLGRQCCGFDPLPVSIPLSDNFAVLIGLAPGDFNGDGLLDLLLGYVSGGALDKRGEIRILLNRGDSTFAPERGFPVDPPDQASPTPPVVFSPSGASRA